MKWKALINDWRIISGACAVGVLLFIIYLRKVGLKAVNSKTMDTTKKLPGEWQLADLAKNHFVVWEGFRNKAYKDSGGLWTIGIGHLIKPGENHLISANLSDAQVWSMFYKDIQDARATVSKKINVPITSGLYSALVSLAFNTGTLYNSIVSLVQASDYAALAKKWKITAITVNKGKTIVKGLINRRKAETQLFV